MPIADDSGSQASGEIPAHLNRWNWGAFLLNWIWGIGNSVWIALLCLIPLVNIVMMFVLGAKGSRWAWEKRLWRDEAHFRSVQRKWAIAGVIVWVMLPMLIFGYFHSVQRSIKQSEPYRMTMTELRSSDAVNALLGESFEAGYLVLGRTIWNNDSDKSIHLAIPLKGDKGNATAHAGLIHRNGVWQLLSLAVQESELSKPIVDVIPGNKFLSPGDSGDS